MGALGAYALESDNARRIKGAGKVLGYVTRGR